MGLFERFFTRRGSKMPGTREKAFNSRRVSRRCSYESLEDRRVMATAVMLGQQFELPSWLTPEQVVAARESAWMRTTWLRSNSA